MTKLRNSVGERIRAIRKAKGLTQQQLAELSGLDDAYVGSVERGERNFSIDTLEKIISSLNMPEQDFFYQDSSNETELIKRKTIDDFSIFLNHLNQEQVEIVKNILNEIKRAF
ncbi:helix-turn-helix domain-containing protein [Paenibacillus amylolyticus]|uniref:helix-turn-helix domain-containing protein n=1 Tax=Paenibacillus amylolyticus TaxID=1451 RepID=UPI0039AEA3AD